jgi:SAM-dependent methyltransferase
MRPCPEELPPEQDVVNASGLPESARTPLPPDLGKCLDISSDAYGMPASPMEVYDALVIDEIRKRWDQKAERWDADLADQDCHLNQDDGYRRFIQAAEAVVSARQTFCGQQLLVDLACGTGQVLAHFLDRFERAVGVDISPRMLGVAAARRLPRTEFLETSCFEFACRIAPAGAVLSRGILLSHYGHRWALPLLRQVHDALVAEGGFAVLDFLNDLARYDYPANPKNKTYFTARQIQSLASEAGFRSSSILGQSNRRVLMLLAER